MKNKASGSLEPEALFGSVTFQKIQYLTPLLFVNC